MLGTPLSLVPTSKTGYPASMKNFLEKIKQYGHFKCMEKRRHVSKTHGTETEAQLPGTRTCNANPHTCRFVLDARYKSCGSEDTNCPAAKKFSRFELGWRVSCGVCKRQWYTRTSSSN